MARAAAVAIVANATAAGPGVPWPAPWAEAVAAAGGDEVPIAVPCLNFNLGSEASSLVLLVQLLHARPCPLGARHPACAEVRCHGPNLQGMSHTSTSC